MREHDFTTLFKTAHMLKDVRLCLEEAQARRRAVPGRRHTPATCSTAAMGRGHGDADYASLIEAAEGLAGAGSDRRS